MYHRIATVLFAILLMTGGHALAQDWPQWRGPNQNGATEATGLPATFTSSENVKWEAQLPGPSSATPIVHGERVYIVAFDPASKNVIGMALNRKTGEEVWRIPIGPGRDRLRGGRGQENYAAECSPVTDGNMVVFSTGLGDIIGVSAKGDEQWRTNIQDKYGKFNLLWGYASSPLLHDGKLYVQVLHQEPQDSYLLGLDLHSGKELFRVIRKTNAPGETKDAYGTPIPRTVDGKTEILVLGADKITAHNPETGEELWRFGDWNPQGIGHWRHVQSPVVGPDGTIYFPTPKKEPVFAINVKDAKPSLAWELTERGATNDVPVPLYYEGLLYILNGGNKLLNCVDPRTGEVIWQGKLDCPTYFRASPTAADGKIYMMNADGEVFVVKAGGDEMQVLNHTKLGGYPARSSIAIAHGNLFVRTSDRLYCIGE